MPPNRSIILGKQDFYGSAVHPHCMSTLHLYTAISGRMT